MKPTVVFLTNEQTYELDAVFTEAQAAADIGKPGLIMAQIVGDKMAVHFLNHEQGIEYQRLIGVPEDKIGKTMRKKL